MSVSNPLKSIRKRKIIELVVVSKKEGSTLVLNSKMSILKLWDTENVGGIPNKIILLIIMTTISNCNIFTQSKFSKNSFTYLQTC